MTCLDNQKRYATRKRKLNKLRTPSKIWCLMSAESLIFKYFLNICTEKNSINSNKILCAKSQDDNNSLTDFFNNS